MRHCVTYYEKCKIVIKTFSLTTAGSRPAARPHPGQAPGSCVAGLMASVAKSSWTINT